MTEDRIFLSSPHMSDQGYEEKYVKEAFDTNWIAPLGENVDLFEKELGEKVGINYAAALSSGTAAIHLALKAAGVTRGDIVFCPTLTFSASANPIMYEGAIPVFIGSDEKTWNMDVEALKEAFLKFPNVKAVIVVHLYGLSADMEPILELCREHGVAVIEDAAESLGTLYKGQYTGTFGDYGIYSFNGNKIITTSGGGMLVSNDQRKVEKIRFWATQSRDAARHYQHSELGYNYRMSNVLAGIGRGQLLVLDDRVEKKRSIYKKYKSGLEDILEIGWMPDNEWDYANYWLSCITLNGKVKPIEVMDALEKRNIESRPIWKPMHLQPYYSEFSYIGNNFAENLFNNGLCLPSDTKMTEEQIDKVIAIVRALYK
ncbi:DegT/DnrJ/EryC1/StrS family aminotransferase [Enterococcus larvae]|uniref:DegT/DnrJ/EryC1/StrS family aminotransferase n=1 Tax=Enterococcus larvae TaxID=2794352 RepID=UPI003F2DF951